MGDLGGLPIHRPWGGLVADVGVLGVCVCSYSIIHIF